MKTLVGLTLALGALGAGAYLMRNSSHASLSGTRRHHRSRRQHRQLRGPAEITELEVFIENDGDLYRQQTVPIMKNLQKKLEKGVFDKSKAEKLWMYLVENGAKKYAKDSGGGTWHKMFSMADRKAVAKNLNEGFLAELKAQGGKMF